LSSTPSTRRNSQSPVRSMNIHQASAPFPNSGKATLRVHRWPTKARLDPFDSGGKISQRRREEIRSLPEDLLSQCLLTIKARERQALSDQPVIAPPRQIGGMVAAPRDSAVRSMFGSDINASCFAERERVRQMDILLVMWNRGFVFPAHFSRDRSIG
jgi:hypothetical protein